jgi:hypothetical protein
MAFILSTKEILQPLYTIRRMIVSEIGKQATITRHWSYFSRLVSNLQKQLYYYKSKIKIY